MDNDGDDNENINDDCESVNDNDDYESNDIGRSN